MTQSRRNSDKIISELKFEKCVSTFMDVNGQVLFKLLEDFFMECHDAFKLEKKSQ